MVEVVPIKHAAHGANGFGIDLSSTITPNLRKSLTDALYKNRVIILKKQESKKAEYVEFRKLGEHQFHKV